MRRITSAFIEAFLIVISSIVEEIMKLLYPMEKKGKPPKLHKYYCLMIKEGKSFPCSHLDTTRLFLRKCSLYNQDLYSDNQKGLMNRCDECLEGKNV